MDQTRVMIIGTYGLVTDALITKFNQSMSEVFVITGTKTKHTGKHKGVIEEYNFPYDNINIPYILEGTKVDVLVYMGAYNSKYSWGQQGESVEYMSGLYNILLSASKAGIKRFIYLSTTDLYKSAGDMKISEDTDLNTQGLRRKTIRAGEELALQFEMENNMEVVILRLSEVYGFYNTFINKYEFSTKVCAELLKGNDIYIDKDKKHDSIHVSDAIEAIFTASMQNNIPSKIYNICSGNSMSENLGLNVIAMLLGITAEPKYRGDSVSENFEYSYDRANKEIGYSPKNSTEDTLIQFVSKMKESDGSKVERKRKDFLSGIRKNLKSIGGWFFPYFETIIVFALIEFLIINFGTISYLSAIDFYLLYIVLIAIIYGKGQTVTALFLAFMGKIHLLLRDSSWMQVTVGYDIYLWLLQIMVIGMGIGFIRDNYKQTIGDKDEMINYLNAELAEIKDINHSNIQIKKIYEGRLVNYQDSFARIYSIVSKLDDLEPERIMFAAIDVVSQIMNSDAIMIYAVDKSGYYARLAAASAKIRDTSIKSIKLDTMGEVYEDIINKKIYVNRSLEPDKPSMVGGVFHEDTLETIIMIKSLPLESTTLYHMNLFGVVTNLITQALHRANYHVEENKTNRYVDQTNILTSKAFSNILNIRQNGLDTNLAEYCMLEIDKQDKTLLQISDALTPILRQQDRMGLSEDGKLYLMLANTNDEEAIIVMARLLQKGIVSRKGVA